MLNLVDSYGATFVIFILACLEIYTFCYMYGINRVSDDAKFMLGFYPNKFFKVCWKYVTPAIMTLIAIYSLVYYEKPTDNGREFPMPAHILGWCIASLGLVWVPIMMIARIVKQKDITILGVSNLKVLITFKLIINLQKVKSAFRPTTNWGPLNSIDNAKYKDYIGRTN